MKLSRLQNFSLFAFSFVCLACCKDKQEYGFLGNIEVGKYQIIQFREYPNGTKDTLEWEAYGPRYLKGGNVYRFNLYASTIFYTEWEIGESVITYTDYDITTNESRSYNSEIESVSNEEFILNYTYYTDFQGIVSDSASGHMTFKHLPL